jgi:hypothetical protein
MENSFHANAGIRDSDLLITKENIGTLIHDFHEPDFAEAAARIELLMNDVAQPRHRAREIAVKLFDLRTVDIERYAALCEKVLG